MAAHDEFVSGYIQKHCVVNIARKLHTRAQIEISEDARLMVDDSGAWVEAWTCVSRHGVNLSEKSRARMILDARLRTGFTDLEIEDEAVITVRAGFDYVQTWIFVEIKSAVDREALAAGL